MKKSFLFILISVNIYAQYDIPQVGDPLPCAAVDSIRWLISSSQFAKGCYKTYNNIEFFFASEDGKKIFFISTSDSNFVTPEGFKVGNSFTEINSKVETSIFNERGWGYYSKLPSGWFANYSLDEASASHHIMVINSDSTVYQFFQRK